MSRRAPAEIHAALEALPEHQVGEILGGEPSTRRVDRVLKLPIYAREGVGHAWLVEPGEQLIEVFRRDRLLWTLVAAVTGSAPQALEPFEAVPLDLAFLWAG